jgi:hypothetical protein
VVTDPLARSFPQAFYRVILLPEVVSGPPGFSTASGAVDLNVSTLSATLASTGANRVLLAGLCWNENDEDTVLSVTYNGVPCAHVLTTNWFYGSGKVALYSLTAPPAGSHALQVTMSGSVKELSLSGLIITNANQSVSLGQAAAYFDVGSADTDNIAVTVPSTTSDLVVDLLGYFAFEPVPGPGQTVVLTSENSGHSSTQMSTKPGAAGATTMSWSVSDPTQISLIGVTVKGL